MDVGQFSWSDKDVNVIQPKIYEQGQLTVDILGFGWISVLPTARISLCCLRYPAVSAAFKKNGGKKVFVANVSVLMGE